jgi:hypothetical protein
MSQAFDYNDEEFRTAVNKARAAGRIAIGMPSDPPQHPTPEAKRRPADAVVRHRPPARVSARTISLCVVGLAAVIGGAAYFYSRETVQATTVVPAIARPEGVVRVISRPAGAQVLVDGQARGTAPINLTLPVGQHTLELSSGDIKRTVPFLIEQGAVVAQYVDLAPVPGTGAGRLDVTSEPAGARVSVDGIDRGITPLALADLTAGEHKITIANADAAVTRTVTVVPGAPASVVVSLAPAGGSAGWVALKSSLPLQISENGSVLATAGVDRIMIPVGRHQLDVTAPDFGFRTTVTVQVQAGKTTTVNVAPPNGKLSINAVPWADVTLDGTPMGTTPLGNVSVPAGMHEVIWRHPNFGERRQTVKVSAEASARAGVDFTK